MTTEISTRKIMLQQQIGGSDLPSHSHERWHGNMGTGTDFWVVVVLRSPIHANEPSEYNGMLYRTSNRVLNNGIKVIILICMDGTSQYHHYRFLRTH